MIWIISELYYPEETSTGYFLTKIAEGVTPSDTVSVICSQPTYSQRGQKAPRQEMRNGVHIFRARGSTLNKNFLPFRLVNFVTISFSLFYKCLTKFRKGDKVLVVTNPPLLPFLVLLACKIKKCKATLLVHDVYPEVFVAVGMVKRNSNLFKIIQGAVKKLYCHVDSIVVIGRDMSEMVTSKCEHRKVNLITNWADLDTIEPLPREKNKVLKAYNLLDSFVVQYCGNMGRTHGLEYLLKCAAALESDIHFLMIGSGARKGWLVRESGRRKLTNVTIIPRCKREELSENLNACDLAVISFIPGMKGVSVPSRMYNIMAAGKPLLAIADSDSELAMVVKEEDIGWVVAPGDIESISAAILDAKSDRNKLAEMGKRARRVAEDKYSLPHIIKSYENLFETL